MSRKSERIEQRIEEFQGKELPAHYLGYLGCFNRQQFYEAHEVLEEMWLPNRHQEDGSFYKGLIQLAGAFVHVQKARLGPALALLRLARANLERYPDVHHSLSISNVLSLIEEWEKRLEKSPIIRDLFKKVNPPRLSLINDRQGAGACDSETGKL